jgi:hypothetical protein
VKILESVKVIYTEEKVVKTICDLCNLEFAGQGLEYKEVEINITTRREYNSDIDIDSYDVCHNCWKAVIVPLFGKPPTGKKRF